MRVAYLEDDPDQAALVRRWLEGAGHSVHHFDRGRTLQRALARESFELYLLDWHLPDIDGLEILHAIRAAAPHAPVIFVTLRDRDEDVVKVLKAGADDYIAKPVREGELLARIEALARRLDGHKRESRRIELTPFVLDRDARSVARDGARIALTDKEYALAEFLFRNAGELVSRRHLLEAVWGLRADVKTRTIDTHMSRLRAKLGLAGTGWRLVSVQEYGYRLDNYDDDAAN
jgi:two-component system, OmpR family, response regulator RegX3